MCQACSNAVERLPLTAQRRIGRKLLVGQADAYYVPKRLMREMTAMLEIFSEEGCWLEVAVSTASAVCSSLYYPCLKTIKHGSTGFRRGGSL